MIDYELPKCKSLATNSAVVVCISGRFDRKFFMAVSLEPSHAYKALKKKKNKINVKLHLQIPL